METTVTFPDIDLVRKVEVYIDSIPKVLSQEYTAVSIQPLPQAIAVEISSSNGPLEADYKAYFTTFPKELEFIATIDEYIRLGQEHMRMLYCYRSVSQAIPEISIEITEDMTSEERAELATKKTEINQKILDVLRPEMNKIQEFLTYTIDAIDCFYSCVSYVCYKEQHKEIIPEGFYLSLIQLLDVLIKLDNLKDFKNGLRKDFARYKRAIGQQPSVEVMEELSKLQSFLAGQDSRKARSYIIQTLRDEVKRINDHENLLIECLEIALSSLDDVNYILPEEKFCFFRVIPYLLLLIDGEADDTKASNIFKNGKVKISNIQKLVKKNPIVPLYADMTLTLEVILQRAPHYDKSTASAWGAEPDSKVAESYDLRTYWETVRNSHSQYLIKFSAAVNRYQKFTFQKNLDEVSVEVASDVYNLVLEGLQKVSRWVMIVKQMLVWKYTHPASKDKVAVATSVDGSSDTALVNSLLERNGLEYGLVLRHNLTKDEFSVLIDFIFMIKSISSHLLKQESLFSPFIRFHIHHSIQQLVQGDLIPLLHRLDKRNKPILPTILKLRSLAADWLSGNEPSNDYKEYSRKQGSIQTVLSHPPRVVGPARTQLYILRTQVSSLCESRSEVRRKESIFGKADLEKSDIEIFDKFYSNSFYFPYLLNYSQHIHDISDLSDLWYREFFLELTKCIQFPIDMSLPWMLIEHVLTNSEENTDGTSTAAGATTTGGGGGVGSSGAGAIVTSGNSKKNSLFLENVFYLFDIYNDAANRSLYQLNSQFLYDEIEAEANLVIDQFYFLLSDEIYNYYKNLSATILLDKSFQLRYDELKLNNLNNHHLPLLQIDASSRYHQILNQKAIQLLGRSINLTMIFTQNITGKFHRDLDIAIKKFESNDLRGIVELKTLLFILKGTHELLSNYLLLDSFDHMVQEMDECWSVTAYRGRISLHILTSLARDIIPNFSYNQYTQRFIPSPIPVRPWEYNKAPKQTILQQCYGNICYKAFENQGKLVRNFFGQVHFQALLSLESVLCGRTSHGTNNLASNNAAIQSDQKNGPYGITQLTMVLDQIVKNLYDKIIDISEYLNALKDSIPPSKPPQAIFRSIGAYGYYEGKLKSLLEFDDLKPEVFQIFREIGNTIVFLRDFSNYLEIHEGLSSHIISALFPQSISGLIPIPPAPAGGGEGRGSISETVSQVSSSGFEAVIEQSPVTKVIQQLQKTLLTTAGASATDKLSLQSYTLIKNPLSLQYLPLNMERQLQYYATQYNIQTNPTSTNAAAASASSIHKNGKNLMKWLLIQLEEFLYQQNFTSEWSPFAEEHLTTMSSTYGLKKENLVLEVENNPSFSKMWSALCFLFCINEFANGGDNDTASEVQSVADTSATGGGTERELTNFAEFGHGFLIAGNLFLHLLGQRAAFELLDYTNQVIRMVDYENEMNESVLNNTNNNGTNANGTTTAAAAASNLDPSLVKEYKSFVIEARKVLQINYEWLSYFHSIYTIRPSYSKYATNKNTFHPPPPPTFTFN